MPLLLKLVADEWQLEVTGPLTRLPDFLPRPTATYRVAGKASLTLHGPAPAATGAPDSVLAEPLFFENTTYDFYLRSRNKDIKLLLPFGAAREHHTGDFTHQAINFGNDVGFSETRISGGQEPVVLRLEVFPTKLDYRTDYVQMRDDVSRLVRNLAMSVQSRTFSFAAPFASPDRTLNEWIELLRHYFSELMKAGESIGRSSHSKLTRLSKLVPIDKSKRPDIRRLERVTRMGSGRKAKQTPSGFELPHRMPELTRTTSFDTPENRYVKHLLLRTAHNLRIVLNTTSSGDEDAELTAEQRFFDGFRPHAGSMLSDIQRLLREEFLRGIEPEISDIAASLVLLKHPSYVRFVKLARLFNGGLSINGQLLRVGIKNVAALYEYWCFLQLVHRLCERFGLEQQTIVRLHHTGIVVTLAKGVQAGVQFRDTATGKRLHLIYDRAFRNLPTITQRPDNVIQLASDRRLYVLDAKYRLAYDNDYRRRYGGVGPTPEDINTMHRYRDAIVAPEPSEPNKFERIIVSAAVLFPYADEKSYEAHRFSKSLAQVRIGGIPFLPGVSLLLDGHLQEILSAEGYTIASK